jgi:hypothetical protein
VKPEIIRTGVPECQEIVRLTVLAGPDFKSSVHDKETEWEVGPLFTFWTEAECVKHFRMVAHHGFDLFVRFRGGEKPQETLSRCDSRLQGGTAGTRFPLGDARFLCFLE